MEIGFVSCTKSKQQKASQPAELYMSSSFFQRAREYAKTNHDRWYILSAKYHLLDPSGPPIDPYDETLTGAPVARKRERAEIVYNQLKDEGLLGDGNRLVFHAGRDYYSELIRLLNKSLTEDSETAAFVSKQGNRGVQDTEDCFCTVTSLSVLSQRSIDNSIIKCSI